MFIPKAQPDGSFLWAHPLGQGHVPLIALSDFGFFTRYVFDNPSKVSGIDLEIASELVTWQDLVETFEKVTGKKGVYQDVSLEDYFARLPGADNLIAIDATDGVSHILYFYLTKTQLSFTTPSTSLVSAHHVLTCFSL